MSVKYAQFGHVCFHFGTTNVKVKKKMSISCVVDIVMKSTIKDNEKT